MHLFQERLRDRLRHLRCELLDAPVLFSMARNIHIHIYSIHIHLLVWCAYQLKGSAFASKDRLMSHCMELSGSDREIAWAALCFCGTVGQP